MENRYMQGLDTANLLRDVLDFKQKYGLVYDGPPRELSIELSRFRVDFMGEELSEYAAAVTAQDLEKQLDALVDLVYVAIGTAYFHGFNFGEAWARVHAANMSKVRAQSSEDSRRGTTFDVVKPPGWKAPDLSDLVQP